MSISTINVFKVHLYYKGKDFPRYFSHIRIFCASVLHSLDAFIQTKHFAERRLMVYMNELHFIFEKTMYIFQKIMQHMINKSNFILVLKLIN